jgi:hypothetical protein
MIALNDSKNGYTYASILDMGHTHSTFVAGISTTQREETIIKDDCVHEAIIINLLNCFQQA